MGASEIHFSTMFAAATAFGIVYAQQAQRNREIQYQKYLAECSSLGVIPKTSHEFMLELRNAESLERMSYNKPVTKFSLF